ncbi:hypothetical protein CDA63_17975 [Hymenobacter amundsenii]|uniref:RCC1-like domain-containing protein n=1 Tax=Hymenobacter amundsenii TaxID=2006685 RepID=A0A246FGQ1_9BACT|nr:T9SS type A sorting domain-containing protein [Hymenobacter amundsenii]OWP61709.1 hypothetical protein CDA63_17975 [Hymenobacter amundsenii]
MRPFIPLMIRLLGRLALVMPISMLTSSAFAQQTSPYIQVSAGGFKSMALRADGTLWAWGSNWDGELGIGDPTSTRIATPRQVALPNGLPPGSTWTQVACGGSHALAITSNGSLWAWGNNGYGQLGSDIGRSSSSRPIPVVAPAGARWLQCAAGSLSSLGIQTDGTLWQWGRYPASISGTWYDTPQQVVAPGDGPGTRWTQVSIGHYHMLALRSDGTLWGWGVNQDGEVGDGTQTRRHSPVAVPVPADAPAGAYWVQATAGRLFSLGLLSTGTLYGWGWNVDGLLAQHTSTLQPVPLPLPANAAPGTGWRQVHAGVAHATAILTDGSLWTWGENVYGQLVNNTQTVPLAPTREATNGVWAQVSGGHVHTLAIGADGSVYAGGAERAPGPDPTNYYNLGQLGNGSYNGSLVLRRTLAVTLGRHKAYQAAYQVYPNPAGQWLTVEGLPVRATLKLTTTLGQPVLTQSASRLTRLNLGNVAAGSYLLTIETDNAPPQTLRVVVE